MSDGFQRVGAKKQVNKSGTGIITPVALADNSFAALTRNKAAASAKKKKEDQPKPVSKKPKNKKPKDDWKDMIAAGDNRPGRKQQQPPKEEKPSTLKASLTTPESPPSSSSKKKKEKQPADIAMDYETQQALEDSQPWHETGAGAGKKKTKKKGGGSGGGGQEDDPYANAEEQWQVLHKKDEKRSPQQEKPTSQQQPQQGGATRTTFPVQQQQQPQQQKKPKPKPKPKPAGVTGLVSNKPKQQTDADGWMTKQKKDNKNEPAVRTNTTSVEVKARSGVREIDLVMEDLDEENSEGVKANFFLKVGKQTAVPMPMAIQRAKLVVDTYADPQAPEELQVYLQVTATDAHNNTTEVLGKYAVGEMWLADSWLQGVIKVVKGEPARAYPVWGTENVYVELKPDGEKLEIKNNLPQANTHYTVNRLDFVNAVLAAGESLNEFIVAMQKHLEVASTRKKKPIPQERVETLKKSLPAKAAELVETLKEALQ